MLYAGDHLLGGRRSRLAMGTQREIWTSEPDAFCIRDHEAAAIDGATGWKKLTKITLPLISPTLFLLIVINIIYGLQVFDSVLIMTNGGPGGATTVFLERIYKYAFKQYKMGLASAYSWILFALILVFTAIQFKLQRKWVNYDA